MIVSTVGSVMVPVAGLEPARCRHRWILSPLRLPIPSHRHLVYRYDIIRQNAEKSKHFSDKKSGVLQNSAAGNQNIVFVGLQHSQPVLRAARIRADLNDIS